MSGWLWEKHAIHILILLKLSSTTEIYHLLKSKLIMVKKRENNNLLYKVKYLYTVPS